MRKLLITGLAIAMLAGTAAMAAPERRGGLIGGLYGCCFEAARCGDSHDGKDVVAMEWSTPLLTMPYLSFIRAGRAPPRPTSGTVR